MFGCSGFGKTRGEKLFSSTPSRLTVSRSAAAVPATQTEGPIARASAAHLGERRRVRPPRLRLGVERGDRALADVQRDAVSPGRARQFERARAGHDARREGQRAHERHRHLRAVKTSKRRNASASRNSKGASRKAESGPERVSGRVTRRGARVRSAARSATAGDCGDARDAALLRARECEKYRCLLLKMPLFHNWRSIRQYEFGTRSICALFVCGLR